MVLIKDILIYVSLQLDQTSTRRVNTLVFVKVREIEQRNPKRISIMAYNKETVLCPVGFSLTSPTLQPKANEENGDPQAVSRSRQLKL